MYKTNFITDVVVKLDFNLPLEIKNNDLLTTFKKNLNIDDIELNEVPLNELVINITEQSKNNFNLIGLQGIYKIGSSYRRFMLSPNYLIYASKYTTENVYNNYEILEEEFSKGLRALNAINKDILYKRFGFRFVNKLKLPQVKKPSDWKDYINSEYISNYGDIKPTDYDDYTLRRKMNTTYLSNGEYIIKVNLGIWNDSFPGTITNNDFVIDIDCYIQSLLLEYSDVKGKLPEMCKIIYRFFNNIISEKFKQIMEKIEDGKK